VANLVLGLATGLLAFQVTLLLDHKLSVACSRGFGTSAVVLLGLSIAFAIWCALNRLAEFRLTAQIARRREKGEESVAERDETELLGKTTWILFRAQLWAFSIGTAALTGGVLLQLHT
jgi:hypothetical protein